MPAWTPPKRSINIGSGARFQSCFYDWQRAQSVNATHSMTGAETPENELPFHKNSVDIHPLECVLSGRL
jgi:hypothetical protein